MRHVLALLVLAALGLPATAGAADPAMWTSPSGNVSCALQGSRLRCDMRRIGTAPPKRPASCVGDWGHAFAVTRGGSRGRRLCVTDAVGGPGTATVGYGRVWRRGGFTCSVERSRVRCVNGRGHGFALRLGRQRLL